MTSVATTKPGTEVAKRQPTAGDMIAQYSTDFANVLPSHIKAATWVRVAQGALKKGKKVAATDGSGRPLKDANGQIVQIFELEQAAINNPASFLSALLDSARQGLEPGTDQYYLTPRKVGGRLEILGMRGYIGEIEMIYRAGAVQSVIAEVVYSSDRFSYKPGPDAPDHERDWDMEDRGTLRLVYAYAVMNSGALSKVIVLNKADIARIMTFAQGVTGDRSPWVTSTEAMWLKSAVHQLRKWVPTSAEYITTQVRANREGMTPDAVAGANLSTAAQIEQASAPLQMLQDHPDVDANATGDAGIFDADVVDEGEVPPPDAPEGNSAEYSETTATEARPVMVSPTRASQLGIALVGWGVRDLQKKLQVISQIVGRQLGQIKDLTDAEADVVFSVFAELKTREDQMAAFTEAFADALA